MGESWTTKKVWVEIIFILKSAVPEIKLFLVRIWLRMGCSWRMEVQIL